jgi:L-threonylcarbamoyladenylate synthase
MSIDFHPILTALKGGGLILHRADTIWGLSCDATQPIAIEKLDQLKQRQAGKSYIVLVSDEAMLERHVQDVPEVAYDLIEASVSPLTIIFPKGVGLADGVCAPDGSVAIRVVKDKLTHDIIYRLRRPIISTSANISNVSPPSQLAQVSDIIRNGVDHIVERTDEAEHTKPSSIIKLALNGEFSFIRT